MTRCSSVAFAAVGLLYAGVAAGCGGGSVSDAPPAAAVVTSTTGAPTAAGDPTATGAPTTTIDVARLEAVVTSAEALADDLDADVAGDGAATG